MSSPFKLVLFSKGRLLETKSKNEHYNHSPSPNPYAHSVYRRRI